jgi:Cytochrome c7 and related cytochrome c
MKKILLLVVFAMVLLVFTASPAFALHSGYDATTGSCRSCHAVHNATGDHLYNSTASAGGPVGGRYDGVKITLNSSSVAQDLCEWCHVYGSSHPVYQDGMTRGEVVSTKATMGMHALGVTTQPDKGAATYDINKNIAGLDCIDCHNAMPHAAKATAGIAFYIQDANVNAMCVRCHEANNAAAHVGVTHPLQVAGTGILTSNYGTQKIAWADAVDCLACHKGGVHSRTATILPTGAVKTSDNSTYPGVDALTTGYKFTNFNFAQARGYTGAYLLSGTHKVQDTQCLSCHQDGTASAGVGVTF